jgi:hypothetical protein
MVKKLVSISLALFIFICMLGATERQAYAYVDPGSGLLALQSLASVAAAFGYFMRKRIRQLFTRADGKPSIDKEGNSIKAA